MSDRKNEQDNGKGEEIVKVNYIERLPEELLIEIFQYLGWVDIVAVRGVCRLWRRVGSDQILLQKCFFGNPRFMTLVEADIGRRENEAADNENVLAAGSRREVEMQVATAMTYDPVAFCSYYDNRQRTEQHVQVTEQRLNVRSSVAGSLRNMTIFFAGFMVFMLAVTGLTVMSSPERRSFRHSGVLIGFVIDFGVTALIFMSCCLARCLRNRTQRELGVSRAEQGRLDESSPLLAVRHRDSLVVNGDDEGRAETEQQAVVMMLPNENTQNTR